MDEKISNQQRDLGEIPHTNNHFILVKNWDRTVNSLQQLNVGELASEMGFDLPTLVATVAKEFAPDLPSHPEYNAAGEKIEDVVVETSSVNGRPIDRLLVTAYPSAANPNPTEMTKFKSGGEIIFVTDGEAELTYAQGRIGESISKSDLITEKVSKGDLIISTDTPNNWTNVFGDKFTFIYFVGNPSGPQTYAEIPKAKVPIK